MNEQDRRAAIELHDRFTHEGMDRRAFMAELTRIAGGAAAASALLTSVAANAHAQPRTCENDARLQTSTSRVPLTGFAATHPIGHEATILTYDAAPAGVAAPRARVLVVHENRGLNEHIRDVARRLALAGYAAVAPDFLSLDGAATPADEDEARRLIGALDMPRVVEAARRLIVYMNGGVGRAARTSELHRPAGVVGFCWGGAIVHRLTLAAGDSLMAGVSFYGPAPAPAEAARLQTPLLVILAERDARVNGTALPYVAAAEAAGKPVRAITYPGVDHAFHNDTSAARYNRPAAEQAWAQTMNFFARHLR